MLLGSLDDLMSGLTNRTISSEQIVLQALEHAQDSSGQGKTVFTRLYAEKSVTQARAIDRARAAGLPLSPLAGLPVSIKDLFDEQGEETLAGSIASKEEGPAKSDADAIAALRRAGAILIGRTSMTEYAFSGLGLNPHYGTPLNPWDRATGRIPGGSSSGAAISVSDGMAAAAIGSDTGGSVRIPAALCGLTGFKPTARRISRRGVYPLSTTLDAVGPIAATVRCCAVLDQIMSQTALPPLYGRPLLGKRLAVPTTLVLDQMDSHVAQTFGAALTRLSEEGAVIEDIPLSELAEIPARSIQSGIAAAEAYALHRQRLLGKSHLYDPRVLSRLLSGREISAADYISCLNTRVEICARVDQRTASYDALLLPTVPTIAPRLQSLIDSDTLYGAANALMLRNTALFNALDRPAISLPCHFPETAPVGLMIVGETMRDGALLELALSVEKALMPITKAENNLV